MVNICLPFFCFYLQTILITKFITHNIITKNVRAVLLTAAETTALAWCHLQYHLELKVAACGGEGVGRGGVHSSYLLVGMVLLLAGWGEGGHVMILVIGRGRGGGGGQVMVLITGRAAIDLGVCCLCARYCVVMTTVVTQTLYGHIVSDIKRLNHKHRNNTVNTVSCVGRVKRWSLERMDLSEPPDCYRCGFLLPRPCRILCTRCSRTVTRLLQRCPWT